MSLESKLLDALRLRGLTLSLAESCTGGSIAARFVQVPGASAVLLGSVVAYTNAWKETFLGVEPALLCSDGAASAEVVEAMVRGLFARTTCHVAAAVSGIAGPSGGTLTKPVGTIWISVAKRNEQVHTHKLHGTESRSYNIELATTTTLELLLKLVESHGL